MFTNDNGPTMRSDIPLLADAHGQAALLLVESLIHGLCENETLNARQAVDIAERAVEVQLDEAEAAESGAAHMWRSHQLLTAITASLRVDDRGPPPDRDLGAVDL